MKLNKLSIRSLSLLALLAVNPAVSAPYYRLWRGFQLPEIESREKFQEAIAKIFVPATVESASGYSLEAYIPAIPNPVSAQENILIPDEVALVVYTNEEKYKERRAHPIGKNYGDLHWKYFIKAPTDPAVPVPSNASRSSVPVAWAEGELLENGKAYDFLLSNPDWQKSLVKIRFLKRFSDSSIEIETLKKLQKDFVSKAAGYLVLVDPSYFMIYEAWESEKSLTDSRYEAFLAKNFTQLGKSVVARNTPKGLVGMQSLSLKNGDALNAQFDSSQSAKYLEKSQVEDYITEQLAEGKSGPFSFTKSAIHPEGLLVVND